MSYVAGLLKLKNMSHAVWEEWITDNKPTSNDIISFSKFILLHASHKHKNFSNACSAGYPIESNQLNHMDLFNTLIEYATYLDDHRGT